MKKPAGVLFDLDGTIVDSAPDYIAALNQLLRDEGRDEVDFEVARGSVSRGAYALLALGFGEEGKSPARMKLRERLLEIYSNALTERSTLFHGVIDVLDAIEQRGITWAIVTNKPTFLTIPVVEHFRLSRRAAAIVCGDTLEVAKPSPEPLYHACQQASLDPTETVMVGDALCDIQAGNAAGAKTVVATYGYTVEAIDVAQWGADYSIDSPIELLKLIGIDS
ncbi:HAD-IIIA family hydrolase [bacterium]|nr:HAD-IIIA family hydrolase [bacterium]